MPGWGRQRGGGGWWGAGMVGQPYMKKAAILETGDAGLWSMTGCGRDDNKGGPTNSIGGGGGGAPCTWVVEGRCSICDLKEGSKNEKVTKSTSRRVR